MNRRSVLAMVVYAIIYVAGQASPVWAQSPIDDPVLTCTHLSVNIRRGDRSGYFDTFLNTQYVARTKLTVGPGRVDWPADHVFQGSNAVRLEIQYLGVRLPDVNRTFECGSGGASATPPRATTATPKPPHTPDGSSRRRIYLPAVWLGAGRQASTATPMMTRTPTATDDPSEPPARIEDSSPLLSKRGQWQTIRDGSASGGSYIVSTAAGDELEARFAGDHAAVLRTMRAMGDTASITIDGVSFGPISTQFFETRWQIPAVFDHLGGGTHVLILTAMAPGFSFDVLEAPSRYAASTDQREAEDRINYYRVMAGMPRARLHRAIDLAAQAHAEYDARNQHREGHRETQGRAGFNGVKFDDRMAYFGYTDYSWEAMLGGQSGPSAAIDGWMSMVFHRLPIMEPEGVDIGFGMAGTGIGRSNVLDTGLRSYDFGSPRTLYTYPVDGQTGVPTQWEGTEGPDPFPGRPKPVGYPVSLHIGSANADTIRNPIGSLGPLARGAIVNALAGDWDIQTATLTDASGRSVPSYVLGPNSHEFLLRSPAVFIVAQQPLKTNTRYTAHVVGTDGLSRPFARQWSFTTGAWLLGAVASGSNAAPSHERQGVSTRSDATLHGSPTGLCGLCVPVGGSAR